MVIFLPVYFGRIRSLVETSVYDLRPREPPSSGKYAAEKKSHVIGNDRLPREV